MKVKEHYMEEQMGREREQQELEEHLHFMTREALLEAAKYLSSDKMDVLMYHCGFTNQDLIKEI